MKQQEQANALLDSAKKQITQAQTLMRNEPRVMANIDALTARVSAALFDGKINEAQKNCLLGFSVIYAMFVMLGQRVPIQYLAYALATTYHETGRTMKPIEEWGKGEGHSYGKPHPETGQVYYGRGYVQLTWIDNYIKAMETTYDHNWRVGKVDFVNKPELALVPFYAAQITVSGMSGGWFTGKKLSDYIQSDGSYDYINARRIINGTDKAETIAAYALDFEKAFYLAIGKGIERMTIKLGSSGDDVRELQLGFGLTPDGDFGSKTETALIDFQRAHNLGDDGICGPSTWNTFDSEIYGL